MGYSLRGTNLGGPETTTGWGQVIGERSGPPTPLPDDPMAGFKSWTDIAAKVHDNPASACDFVKDPKKKDLCVIGAKAGKKLKWLGYNSPAQIENKFFIPVENGEVTLRAIRSTKLQTDPNDTICAWPFCKKIEDLKSGDIVKAYHKTSKGSWYHVLSSTGKLGYVRGNAVVETQNTTTPPPAEVPPSSSVRPNTSEWDAWERQEEERAKAWSENVLIQSCYARFPNFDDDTGKCLELAQKGEKYILPDDWERNPWFDQKDPSQASAGEGFPPVLLAIGGVAVALSLLGRK